MLHMPCTFQPMNYRTASDRKRLTVKDWSSIIGYCSSAHGWKERRKWSENMRICLLLELPVPAAERASWNRTSLATATRRAHTARTSLRAHTNDSFEHTWLCFNLLNKQARLPQPCMRDYRFHLLWLFPWPGLEKGAGACIDLRGEARQNNRGEIYVPNGSF